MNAQNLGSFVCQACGKAYLPKPQLVGRRVRCACGGLVDTGTADAPAAADVSTKRPVAATAAPAGNHPGHKPQQAALHSRHAMPSTAAPVPIAPSSPPAAASFPPPSDSDTYGLAPGPEPISLAPPDPAHLPPVVIETAIDPADGNDEADDASADPTASTSATSSASAQVEETDALFRPSAARDVVIPSILIAAGILLAVLEVTRYSNHPVSEAGAIISGLAFKLVLSSVLVLGGMYLAALIAEVVLIGPPIRTVYKLLGVAIGCCAIYGVLSYSPTDAGGNEATYAAMRGTFAAVVAYWLAYKLLLRLNVRDASICTLITIILTSMANYFAYKLEGATSGAWF